jgi:trans-aconitate 2-methyltransferase
MGMSKDWDPDLYLKFKDERTQPAIDLISKINAAFQPESILDVGCGPGNSSQALLERWPEARLTGIDNSASMIEKAKATYPNNLWVLADAASYAPTARYDLVFSNATIQWIPDHEKLFKKLFNLINSGGSLAIQVPRFDEMPVSKAIQEVSSREKWEESTRGCADLLTRHDYKYYFELMSADYQAVEMWQTDYIHILESQYAILEWIRSTAIKPYLDCINEEGEKALFESELLAEIKRDYPVQRNGKVIFPFRRLFMIGYK